MNSLISINNKFMSITPKELIDLILESKYTKGVEAYINIDNDEELKYLDDLVYELKKNNFILQIHGEIETNIDKQLEFIKKLENYSDYLGMPIVITMHTIYDEDKSISLNKTLDYISNLLERIDSNKIIISLENLDDKKDMDRLGKDELREIILNNENLFFTYDIGHEIINYGDITSLDKYVIDKIRNIHMHTNNNGIDHMPIYKEDINWNSIIKSLLFLKVNNYKYNIVFEYGIEYCIGNTLEEKIKDYLNSIDYISERIN